MVETKDIPGMPGYRADSEGQIWSCYRMQGQGKGWGLSDIWKKLKSHPSGKYDRHLKVTLSISGERKTLFVHYLVCITFNGPRPTGKEVRHLDGDDQNNKPGNLAWGTKLENAADSLSHGTRAVGEKNGKTNLTVRKVKRLMKLLAQGKSHQSIGDDLGIPKATASSIISGRSWGHVTGYPNRRLLMTSE